jgi:hypothetical protein
MVEEVKMGLELQELHRRFWHREPADRLLVGESREGVFFLQPFLELGVKAGPLPRESVPEPAAFIEPYFRKTLRGDPLDGDLYWVLKPPRALPWMEAIVGCGVHVSASAKAMPDVAPKEIPDLTSLDLDSNGWLHLMTSFTQNLAAHFGGRYPVGQTLMRGPSDMLAALLGLSFYTELCDNPMALKVLARQCTKIWIEVLQTQFRHIPMFQGGHVAGPMGVWAPGPVAVYQEDAAGFISESMYREVFWECDLAIANAFPFSLLHLHSASLHILKAVLEIPSLTAVNVVVDPVGPTLTDLLPNLRRIQAAGKALHLHGNLSVEDVQFARSNLSVDGLCLSLVRDV